VGWPHGQADVAKLRATTADLGVARHVVAAIRLETGPGLVAVGTLVEARHLWRTVLDDSMGTGWAGADVRAKEGLVLQLGRRVRRGEPRVVLLAAHTLVPR
jgi:hypothetical protein